jgi:hypothetical protein
MLDTNEAFYSPNLSLHKGKEDDLTINTAMRWAEGEGAVTTINHNSGRRHE